MNESRTLITNGRQNRSLQKAKPRMRPSPDLTPSELRAIERFESGKGKYRNFKNAEEVVKWLHGKDRKSSK